MKKDLIFASALILVGLLLFMLGTTGITAHIVISIIGVALLIAYTVLAKKNWKIPALEIAMRVSYGIALITGVVIMNVTGIVALAIAHKVFAALFIVLLVVQLIHKLIVSSKA